MNRLALPIALCGVLAAGVSGSAQRTVFRTGTEVVLVPVSVVQGRNPVAGLTSADFVLLDNGVAQTIDVLPMDEQPIDVTVILGTAPLPERDRLVRSGASTDRLHEMLRADDRIRVISAGSRWTPGRAEAPSESRFRDRELVQTRGSSTLDALFYALTVPVEPDRRHLLVFFTDGRDTWSTLEPRQMAPLVARSDAVIHVVFYDQPPDPGRAPPLLVNSPDPGRWRASVGALRDAARRTGGHTHQLDDRAAAFRQILDDFRSSYLLRYSPQGVTPGGWHEIAVKVTRPGRFTIRARSGYEGKAGS
jgi:hypothetical protein